MTVRNRAVSVICLALALLALSGAAAQERAVFLLTPAGGPLADVTNALLPQVTATGATASVITKLPEQLGAQDVLVINDDHLTDAGLRTRLQEWVRQGGGLVLLVGPSTSHYAQATEFLQPLGAQVNALPAEGDNVLTLGNNPVTGGLKLGHPVSVRMEITGAAVLALGWAGNRAALAQIRADQGGVIVLPASLLVAAVRSQPQEATPLTLAARATAWANRPFDAAGGPLPTPPLPPVPSAHVPALPPAAATSLPLETTDFAGITLYDCRATDDSWPQINALVQGLLKDEGFEVKALDVKPGASSLVAALQSEPKLAVLGTWRELSEAETVAVYYYVLGGGRLLALAHATTATQVRLTYLNTALNAFSVFVSLGRPGGATAVYPGSPLKGALHGPEKLPAGIQVGGDGGMKALMVDRSAAMSTAKRGNGRFLVLDAHPLLDSTEYRADLKEGIRWLFSQET